MLLGGGRFSRFDGGRRAVEFSSNAQGISCQMPTFDLSHWSSTQFEDVGTVGTVGTGVGWLQRVGCCEKFTWEAVAVGHDPAGGKGGKLCNINQTPLGFGCAIF